MKITSFVNKLQEKNFDFITKLNSLVPGDQGLNKEINNYKTRLLGLKYFINGENTPSKTDTIIAIHNFIKDNRDLLIKIYKHASKQELRSDSAKTKAEYQAVKDEAFKLLQQGRKFNYWAESIIAKDSFSLATHLLSRDIDWNKSKAVSYKEAESLETQELNNQRDLEAVVEGKGLGLPKRLDRERIDPQHRAWGTNYPPTRRVLMPMHDDWAKNPAKTEDLTVEIEFDNEKKNKAIQANYYFSYEEALQFKLSTNAQNELCQGAEKTPFTTGGATYIFVMDMQGNLFVYPDNYSLFQDDKGYREVLPQGKQGRASDQYVNGKRIGHPAFTRGEVVACAGEITIENGKITKISNSSGHYMPGNFSLHRAAKALDARNVLAPNCIVEDTSQGRKTRQPWHEYSAAYDEKLRNHLPIRPVDLSEKPNPLPMLNGIKGIHEHIKARGLKTANARWGGVSGDSYFSRSVNFIEILEALSKKDYDGAIQCIDKGIAKMDFKQTDTANEYKALLIELRGQLDYCRNHPVNVLNDQYVHKKVESYFDMYVLAQKMRQATFAETAQHTTFFGMSELKSQAKALNTGVSDNELKARLNEAKNEYKYKRQELPDEYRKEFQKPDELIEIERANTKTV